MIKAIAACNLERVIGMNGKLPWHLPADLKRFKDLTLHQIVIMGRKTWESLGRPLPMRENWVLTRQVHRQPHDGVHFFHSLNEIRHAIQPTRHAWIIGGAEIYTLFLPYIDELEITWVRYPCSGDAYFPAFENAFQVIRRSRGPTDAPFETEYVSYRRRV